MPQMDYLRQASLPALLVLLVMAWLAGGVTVDPTPADEWLQLLALPVIVIAAISLSQTQFKTGLQRWAVATAFLILLVPALQLLPTPEGLWHASAPRQALAADIAVAGVSAIQTHGSLTPNATEAGLWALLPAVAAFLAALVLPAQQRRVVIKVVLLLVLANVLFAFFQVGLPPGSAMLLHRDAGFGGLLANTNHHATALNIGMVLAVGQGVHAWRSERAGRGRPHRWLVYAGFALACFVLLPLTTSRAGMVLALPALAFMLLLSGALPYRKAWRSKRSLAVIAGAVVFAAIGVRAALGWMAVDQAEELRHAMTQATAALGAAHAPWGSGVGSFVQVFEQAATSRFWLDAYVNHAHNEYAQWWLEAGWSGAAAMLAAGAVLAVAGWKIARARGRDGNAILAASCFVTVCVVLAHSWADFPLRTTTLMVTSAALVGLMFSALAELPRRSAGSDQEAHETLAQEHEA